MCKKAKALLALTAQNGFSPLMIVVPADTAGIAGAINDIVEPLATALLPIAPDLTKLV